MIMYKTGSPKRQPKNVAPVAPRVIKVNPAETPVLIKLSLVTGLKSVVLDEIAKYPDLKIVETGEDKIYLEYIKDFRNILKLRGVLNVFAVKREASLNPYFISNHKSILGDLIDITLGIAPRKKNVQGMAGTAGTSSKKKTPQTKLDENKQKFKTFKLRCAGAGSKEVKEIQDYIVNTYKLIPTEEADMEIHLNKPTDAWEVGVRLTSRPLSLRDYRVANIKGGLNPTIAYAMNTFCNLTSFESYLNICSGSGTLLIEAGISNPKLKLMGFDINGKSNALAVENIKKAGLIKKIQLKTADIYDKPDLGKFDTITSDLPFGMQISKDEDLGKLYQAFVNYCEETLSPQGRLVIYTTEHKLLTEALKDSKFNTIKILDLVVPTSVGAYLYPKIFVCRLK